MLFDLSSPRRRRFIRVVYSLLAFLFFIGFVGFGIGGEVGSGGGLLDAIGLSDDSSGDTDAAEDSISDAEEKLEADPQNERALADLVLGKIQLGNAAAETDDAGNVTPSTESLEQWQQASDDYQRYLDLEPRRPNSGAAGQLLSVYSYLLNETYQDAAEGEGRAADVQALLDDATEVASVSAEANPGQGPLAQLALFAYAAGDEKAGDAAADEALTAEGDLARGQVKRTLKSYRKQGKETQTAIAELEKETGGQSAGEQALEDPFGDLGGASTSP